MSEYNMCDETKQKYYSEYLDNYKDISKSKFHCNCGKFIKCTPTIFKSHFFSKRHQSYINEMEEIKNDFKNAILIEL